MRIVDVTAVSSGSGYNWAIRNRSSSAVVERSTLRTEGGTVSYGISSIGVDAVTTVRHSVIEVTNATGHDVDGGTGVLIVNGPQITIEHSEIAGASYAVRNDSNNDALIGASRLEGGPVSGAICAGVYDESFTFFAGPACP